MSLPPALPVISSLELLLGDSLPKCGCFPPAKLGGPVLEAQTTPQEEV